MHDLLKKVIDRNATASDVALLEELCDMVKSTSLCGLGQSSPNPVLTTLRYFRNEYEALVVSDQSVPDMAIADAKETV
jgi:bidirectional [NiFe] hydrogenase diaphorase subunit